MCELDLENVNSEKIEYRQGQEIKRFRVVEISDCGNCEIGHPVDEKGNHYPTQRLGMIPVSKCKRISNKEQRKD